MILFSRDLFVWFKSFTALELGVSEFWQFFPLRILSLEFVLGLCLGIAKGRDCKVEFIQLYWLYSMPNLLVIQHLETLYLDGNNVRVICDRV